MCPRRSSDCSSAEFELNYRTGSGSDLAVLVPLNESLCAAQRPGRCPARTDECVRVDLATAQLPNLSSTTEQEAVATWPFRCHSTKACSDVAVLVPLNESLCA